MNPILRTLLAAGAVSSAFLGCTDNESTIFIQGVLVPEPPQCVVAADPAGTYLGSGLLDVALRSNYEAALLVGNQYAPRGSKQTLRTETTRVTLTGAEVKLKDAGTDSTVAEFSVYGSGFAPSSRSEDPGWGLLFANLVPTSVAEGQVEALRNAEPGTTVEYVASIRVFGRTLGGQDIESGDYSFPIELCYGCLVDYSQATITAGGNRRCAPDKAVVQNSCHPGQDAPIDCRTCTSLPICATPDELP